MSALVDALIAELDDRTLARLAEQLRPYLDRSDSTEDLLTPAQAAARLNVHAKTLTRAAAAGRMPGAERVGRSWRFHAGNLHLDPPAGPPTTPAVPKPSRRSSAHTAADAIRGQATHRQEPTA